MTTDTSTVSAVSSGEFEHPDPIENQAFGFWIYIMSDLVLFAAIFATYAVLGHNYAGGLTCKDLFHLPYTFGETMLLNYRMM
jgi:cytochrome o ubiquinol oxidase subunit 3